MEVLDPEDTVWMWRQSLPTPYCKEHHKKPVYPTTGLLQVIQAVLLPFPSCPCTWRSWESGAIVEPDYNYVLR